MDYKPYLDLITSMHRDKPRYMRWLSFLLSLIDPGIGLSMVPMFDPHSATGDQQDITGELVGMPRGFGLDIPGVGETMDDALYRKLILSKIIRNQFKGRQGDLPDLWANVFGSDLQAVVTDNQNMTMGVELVGDYSALDVALVLSGHIVPKPMGVGMRVHRTTEMPPSALYAGACIASTAMIVIRPDTSDPAPFTVHLGIASGALGNTATIEIKKAQ